MVVLGPKPEKMKLSGFNNLTKILSFNLYDFCITFNEQQRNNYVKWINDKYSAQKIVDTSKRICEIIEANILAISQQDYDPVGASAMVLMSDIKHPPVASPQVSMHLDKSHITAHTYPDADDPEGICTFRVDIDIATCGEIIPLSAINHLFEAFECDVVVIDYVVRGYTRLAGGKKIYNDHNFNSIREFIRPEILKDYIKVSDINMPQDNIWQTKLLIGDHYGPERYVMDEKDCNNKLVKEKMAKLRAEMQEVFNLIH